MNVPLTFHIRYWLVNIALGMASSFLVLCMVSPLIAIAPWVGAVIFSIFMVYTYSRFLRRADLEYAYRLDLIDKVVRRAIRRTYGYFSFLRFFLDELNQISAFGEDFLVKLLAERSTQRSEDLEFAVYMKLADIALKNGSYEKEKTSLESALEKKPGSMVAHFRLGVSLERSGLGVDAIKQYQSALHDPDNLSDHLKEFIAEQISRVASSGPLQKPPMPGMRFLSW